MQKMEKLMKIIKLNKNMKERIFVCIASYRDKQLERTVRSVIENAEHPELIDI